MSGSGNDTLQLQETSDGRRVQAFAETHGATSYTPGKNFPDADNVDNIVPRGLADKMYREAHIAYFPESETKIDSGVIASYVNADGPSGQFTAFMEGDPDEIEKLTEVLQENHEDFGLKPLKQDYNKGVLTGWYNRDPEARFGDGGKLGTERRKKSAARLGAYELLDIDPTVERAHIDEVRTPTEEELYIQTMKEVSNWEGDGTLGVKVPIRYWLPNAHHDVVNTLDRSGHDPGEMTILGKSGGANLDKDYSTDPDVIVYSPGVTDETVYDVNTTEGFELSQPSQEESEDSGFLDFFGIEW